MEKTIITRTIRYLIAKDIWLSLLVFGHILLVYIPHISSNRAFLSILGVGAILWIFFYIKLICLAQVARKDQYLKAAFEDELFKKIKVQAGYNAYISMVLCSLLIVLYGIFSDALSMSISAPIYIPCEIVFLVGVITDDLSKIYLSRG